MNWLADTLRAHPEIALFLALALGYALSRIKVGPLQLNVVVGVLIAGVLIGQLDITMPAAMQWAFFMLFLFSIGYQTGPQFIAGLKRGGLQQVGLALLFSGAALAATLGIATVAGFDAGSAAGLLAGSLNASAAIGTGGDAIGRLVADPATRQTLATNLTVAFAVTYLVGLLTEIGTLATLAPRLMRVDLARACRELEQELGIRRDEVGVESSYDEFAVRAYRIPPALEGTGIADLERSFAPARVFVERVRTARGLADAETAVALCAGDLVALSGRLAVLTDNGNPLRAYEVDDAALLDIPTVTVDVALSRRDKSGRTLASLVEELSAELILRSVFARRIRRGRQQIPVGPGVVLQRGDVLTLSGPRHQIERIAERIGAAHWPSLSTDVLALSMAIGLGGLAGLATMRIAGLDVGVSMPVGVLAGGMLAGWLHAAHPRLARVPEATLSAFDAIGLGGFLAIVGLSAGPGFVSGLRSSGVALVAAGVLACLLPNLVTILVGRYALKMHPGLLLGICAGAGTSPAGLAAVQAKAQSSIPTLGYGVSYAVGNVMLALWGSVIVLVMTRA